MEIEKWANISIQEIQCYNMKKDKNTRRTPYWSIVRLIEECKDGKVLNVPIDHIYVGHHIMSKPTIRNFVTHMRAVLDADLNYPVILDENGELIDGRHRLAKAIHLNHKTIKAVRFNINPPPHFYR